MSTPPLHTVSIRLCEDCMSGQWVFCDTYGCALEHLGTGKPLATSPPLSAFHVDPATGAVAMSPPESAPVPLKPCPFCGGKAYVENIGGHLGRNGDESTPGQTFTVYASVSCEREGGRHAKRTGAATSNVSYADARARATAEAIAAWNTRAVDDEDARYQAGYAAGVTCPRCQQPDAATVPWQNAGGPNECAHGYAAGVTCPSCVRESMLSVVRMRSELAAAWTEAATLREFVRECADNWDCDDDAHRYGTTCRKCDARALLVPTAKGKL